MLGVAGGAVALILVFITIPMYVRAKRMGPVDAPGWSLKRWAHPMVLASGDSAGRGHGSRVPAGGVDGGGAVPDGV